MSQTSDTTAPRRSALPLLAIVLAIALAAGSVFWTNRQVEAVQAAMTAALPHQESNVEPEKQAEATLQQTIQDIQASQQKLGDQIKELQTKIASESGERKLMSDQLGALSSRVDALSSANADAAAGAQQLQKKRGKR